MKKLYCIIYIGIFMLLLAGCQDEGMFTPSEEKGIVTYSIRMDDGLQSRSIGDETIVNNLSILVFDKNKTLVLKKDDLNWNNLKPEDLQFSLLKGEYQVLFWLQYADKNGNTYTINDEGKVSVAYNNNWKGSIEDMKKWDAFYYVDKLEINNDAQTKPITLTRPLGQLNWADSQLVPSTDKHSVVITLSGIATSFDPFLTEESEVQPLTEKDEITFTFNAFTDEPLTTKDGNYYYYLSCNYLFPTKLTATFELQDKEENSLKKVGIEEPLTIEIVSNTRTNVLGTTVLKPEAPETNGAWDGITLTMPESEDDCYIIDKPSDLAWLGSDENILEEACTLKVVKNIDMNCTEETEYSLTSLALPAGSIFMGVADENNVSPCISNIKLTTGGLFGDATNITVQNLNLDNVTVTSESHVGVLVNTLIGNGTFTNVSISNSSATTTNGAAGGMVGYIVRASEKDRSETLSVVFNNCDLIGVTANGSQAEGKFVGLLSGYDYQEALTFDAACSSDATTKVTDFASLYSSANQSVWCDDIENTYDGWLGDETYRRGTVIFDETRFIPKWDGATTIEPLIENSSQLIYSPFDLASLQKGNYASVIFKTNVDMANKLFVPIRTINNLDGENNSLYNLYIYEENVTHDGVAFIRTSIGETVHKNLTFCNASISATHNEDTGNAYGGTLCSYVAGTKYTVQNITCTNGELNAVCKMGGLLGRVGSTEFYCSNNHVDGYSLGNYKVDSNPETFSHTVGPIFQDGFSLLVYSVRNLTAHAEATFYPQGEVGGLIGFIISNYSEVSDCTVKNTRINCYGQKDNTDGINVTGEQKGLLGSWKPTFKMNVKYTIAGRHVNEFIGDIRTISGSEKVYVSNCEVENNIYGEGYFKDTHKYNNNKNEIKIIGRAYYVGGEFMGKTFGENKGEVYVDGTQVLEVASASL